MQATTKITKTYASNQQRMRKGTDWKSHSTTWVNCTVRALYDILAFMYSNIPPYENIKSERIYHSVRFWYKSYKEVTFTSLPTIIALQSANIMKKESNS